MEDSITYQRWGGCGASLTDAACWLLKYKLSAEKRDEVLCRLFRSYPDGIGISILRQIIGSCDFAWEAWTLDDTEDNAHDFTLAHFSLWREDDYIRPILDLAHNINPGKIKIIATPFSPPAWMRSKKGLFGNGGYLRHDCYDVYSDYFVAYIKQYGESNTPIYAVTIQNEPKYAPEFYPGMIMSAEEQIEFIRDWLGPKFLQNNIDTKRPPRVRVALDTYQTSVRQSISLLFNIPDWR